MITSNGNSTIKEIRRLRHRKERDLSGKFFIEGIRIVGESVLHNAPIDFCIVAPELLAGSFAQELLSKIHETRTPRVDVSADVFRSLSNRDGPQGIGAVVLQQWVNLHEVFPDGDLCWVALHSVADPGNVGTILRTCDAVGAAGVIFVGTTTDPHDATSIRGSMGSIFTQTLIRTEWSDLVAWARKYGCSLVCTSDRAPLDYSSVEYNPPIVLSMGSERAGIPAEHLESCDYAVRIPMVGSSDSLNLAMATGIVLYEVFNQQRGRLPFASKP